MTEVLFDIQLMKKGLLMAVETTVLSVFTLKAGYDLWKLAKAIEFASLEDCEKLKCVEYDDDLPSLIGLDESKCEFEGKQEEICITTAKQEALDLLEAERLDALKSSALINSLLACSSVTSKRLLDPSAHLLMLILIAGIWHMQRKLLVHAYDEGLVHAFESLDRKILALGDSVSRQCLTSLLKVCRYLTKLFAPVLRSDSLQQITTEADILSKMVSSQARDANLRELKATASIQERMDQERRITILKIRSRYSRMSSAF